MPAINNKTSFIFFLNKRILSRNSNLSLFYKQVKRSPLAYGLSLYNFGDPDKMSCLWKELQLKWVFILRIYILNNNNFQCRNMMNWKFKIRLTTAVVWLIWYNLYFEANNSFFSFLYVISSFALNLYETVYHLIDVSFDVCAVLQYVYTNNIFLTGLNFNKMMGI